VSGARWFYSLLMSAADTAQVLAGERHCQVRILDEALSSGTHFIDALVNMVLVYRICVLKSELLLPTRRVRFWLDNNTRRL
jgi:hypothetical protein